MGASKSVPMGTRVENNAADAPFSEALCKMRVIRAKQRVVKMDGRDAETNYIMDNGTQWSVALGVDSTTKFKGKVQAELSVDGVAAGTFILDAGREYNPIERPTH